MAGLTEAPTAVAEGDDARITAAGEHRKGQFRCVGCGRSLTVYRELPACPSCGGTAWQAVSWQPFGRVRASD